MERLVSHDKQWESLISQTCSFETSKKLWNSGIRIYNSVCSYVKKGEDKYFELNYFFPDVILNYAYIEQRDDDDWQSYPAPMAEDLRPMLKDKIVINKHTYQLGILIHNDYISVYYWCYSLCKNLGGEIGKHEKFCEAFAEVALRLNEAGGGNISDNSPILV